MKELIIRLSSSNADAELCEKDGNSIRYKAISNEALILKLNDILKPVYGRTSKDIVLLNPQIIGLNRNHVVINQPEAKKIVHLSVNNVEKTYKINMPNAIYIIEYCDDKISEIEAYSYKEFDGIKTKLFAYPMPNELFGNTICMGNAPKKIIKQDYVITLEKVIFTSYSHELFSGINGFTKSADWFEHLSNNPVPYKLFKSLNKTLGDVLHG